MPDFSSYDPGVPPPYDPAMLGASAPRPSAGASAGPSSPGRSVVEFVRRRGLLLVALVLCGLVGTCLTWRVAMSNMDDLTLKGAQATVDGCISASELRDGLRSYVSDAAASRSPEARRTLDAFARQKAWAIEIFSTAEALPGAVGASPQPRELDLTLTVDGDLAGVVRPGGFTGLFDGHRGSVRDSDVSFWVPGCASSGLVNSGAERAQCVDRIEVDGTVVVRFDRYLRPPAGDPATASVAGADLASSLDPTAPVAVDCAAPPGAPAARLAVVARRGRLVSMSYVLTSPTTRYTIEILPTAPRPIDTPWPFQRIPGWFLRLGA